MCGVWSLGGTRRAGRAPPMSYRSGPGLVTVVGELPIGRAPPEGGGLKPRRVARWADERRDPRQPRESDLLGTAAPSQAPLPAASPPVGPSAQSTRPCLIPGDFWTPLSTRPGFLIVTF